MATAYERVSLGSGSPNDRIALSWSRPLVFDTGLFLAWLLHQSIYMRIAIPVWKGRVSPVFDVAKTIRVTDIDGTDGEPSEFEVHAINSAHPGATLTDLGVDLLVCSAISSPLEAILWVSGIEVISDICGSPDEILEAIAAGDNELREFRSPGSRRKSKRSPVVRASVVSPGTEPPR